MAKCPVLILVGILFFSAYRVFAGLEFSEIMYDLSGADESREWVEIFNDSSGPIGLSELKFFEADTNHKLVFVAGLESVPPGGYAVIAADAAKFKSDWPAFAGNLFDSSYSLNNSGETLALKNEDEILDQVSYSSSLGGAGDGNTIGKISGAWRANAPTPGGENKITSPSPPLFVKESSTKIQPEPEILLQNEIPASISSEPFKQDDFSWLLYVTTLILITGGSLAIYFVRRRKKISIVSDEFEILE
ncbi:MAG: lamin tail domain-containing protein [Patescibacteria group bacterium]